MHIPLILHQQILKRLFMKSNMLEACRQARLFHLPHPTRPIWTVSRVQHVFICLTGYLYCFLVGFVSLIHTSIETMLASQSSQRITQDGMSMYQLLKQCRVSRVIFTLFLLPCTSLHEN